MGSWSFVIGKVQFALSVIISRLRRDSAHVQAEGDDADYNHRKIIKTLKNMRELNLINDLVNIHCKVGEKATLDRGTATAIPLPNN